MKMSKTIAAFSAVVMALSASVSLNQAVSAAGDFVSYADEVVSLVNAERVSAGLNPLESVPVLNEVATMRSQEITRSFSHTRPDGRSCSTALNDYGVKWKTSGENIAYGYDSPESVVNGWMNSAGHRANILNANFEYIGVGVVEYGGLLYWTQTFTGGSEFGDFATSEISVPIPENPETVSTPCNGENCEPVNSQPSVPCVGENCQPANIQPSVPCVGENCIPFSFDCLNQNKNCQIFSCLPDCLQNAPYCDSSPICGNASPNCLIGALTGLTCSN